MQLIQTLVYSTIEPKDRRPTEKSKICSSQYFRNVWQSEFDLATLR